MNECASGGKRTVVPHRLTAVSYVATLTCLRTSERVGRHSTPIRPLLERFRREHSTGS